MKNEQEKKQKKRFLLQGKEESKWGRGQFFGVTDPNISIADVEHRHSYLLKSYEKPY